MNKLTDIDPLSSEIPALRAIEFGELTKDFAHLASLTVRQERDFELLVTAAYIAGAQDAVITSSSITYG